MIGNAIPSLVLITLAAVVAFFNSGGDGPPVLGSNEISPLALSQSQAADLVAFLKAAQ